MTFSRRYSRAQQRVIGLDRCAANVDTSQVTPRSKQDVKADPPPVFFSQTPAVLVNIDSAPIWSPIGGTDLRFVVNTNWDLFRYPNRDLPPAQDTTMADVGIARRPAWRQATAVPASFRSLPDDGNWTDVKAALPTRPTPRRAVCRRSSRATCRRNCC